MLLPKVGDFVRVDLAINNRYRNWKVVGFVVNNNEPYVRVQYRKTLEETKLSNFRWDKQEKIWWLKAYNKNK